MLSSCQVPTSAKDTHALMATCFESTTKFTVQCGHHSTNALSCTQLVIQSTSSSCLEESQPPKQSSVVATTATATASLNLLPHRATNTMVGSDGLRWLARACVSSSVSTVWPGTCTQQQAHKACRLSAGTFCVINLVKHTAALRCHVLQLQAPAKAPAGDSICVSDCHNSLRGQCRHTTIKCCSSVHEKLIHSQWYGTCSCKLLQYGSHRHLPTLHILPNDGSLQAAV
jgi:hypothetical protein